MTDRLLRLPAIQEITGLSRTTIYRWVQAGRFPSPVSLGANSIAWRQSDVTAWIEQLPRTKQLSD